MQMSKNNTKPPVASRMCEILRQPYLKDSHREPARTTDTSGGTVAMQALPPAQEGSSKLAPPLGQPPTQSMSHLVLFRPIRLLIVQSMPGAEPGNEPRDPV